MNNKTKAAIWEQAPMLRPLLYMVLGIVGADIWSNTFVAKSTIIFCMVGAFAALAISQIVERYQPSAKWLTQILIAANLIILGFGMAHLQQMQRPLLPSETDNSQASIAVITSPAAAKKKSTKYEVAIYKKNNSQYTFYTKGFLYLSASSPLGYFAKGDTLLVPQKWRYISNAGNPYEMDYQKFCARKNIFVMQFAQLSQVALLGSFNKKQTSFIENTHQYCWRSINTYIQDSTTNALLKAMLLGDEQDIDPNTRDAYADTGIIHIVSISGAHVAILFIAIGFLFRKTTTPIMQAFKIVLSMLLIWFYVLLAGAATPALRAAIMFSILLVGQAFDQQNNSYNQLFTAGFILLLLNPLWLFTVGYQLSFVAVLSINIFYKPLLALYRPRYLLDKFLYQAAAVSIAAELLVAPIVAYYFHSFPPLFIIANIIASLAMTVVLTLGLGMLIVSAISPIAQLLAVIITLVSRIFHQQIAVLQQWNAPMFKNIFVPGTMVFAILFCAIAFYLFWQHKNKQALWLSLTALVLVALLHAQQSWRIRHQDRIVVFNENGAATIERYIGSKCISIASGNNKSYAAKQARIGFGSLSFETDTAQKVHFIGHQKLLLIDSTQIIPQHFPVDVLIVTTPLKWVKPEFVIAAYAPKQIVLSNSIKQYQYGIWQKACLAQKIALHYCKTDGAYTLQ